jgi:hypothetical protein
MSFSQTGVGINAVPETGAYMFTGNKLIINVTANFLNPGFIGSE